MAPGKLQGLGLLQAGGDLVQPGRIQGLLGGGTKECPSVSGAARGQAGAQSESTEPEGPAVSRRREGNPTLVNLLANEAH